jgi:hypothetical protein
MLVVSRPALSPPQRRQIRRHIHISQRRQHDHARGREIVQHVARRVRA